MRKNQTLAKIRAGQPTTGAWLNCGYAPLAEIAAHAGFDWVLLDGQHGYWGDEAFIAALTAIATTESTPLARVLRNDPGLIGKALDAGALGVIVPLVNTPEEAALAAKATRYAPQGYRSIGGSRRDFYGDDYTAKANDEIMLAVMIESREAAEHAAEIISVPGVDVGFIGPGDLALSMGTFGRVSAEHEAMVQKVLAAGKTCGVPVGIYCTTVEEAIKRAAQGFTFTPCMTDTTFFTQSWGAMAKKWRER